MNGSPAIRMVAPAPIASAASRANRGRTLDSYHVSRVEARRGSRFETAAERDAAIDVVLCERLLGGGARPSEAEPSAGRRARITGKVGSADAPSKQGGFLGRAPRDEASR